MSETFDAGLLEAMLSMLQRQGTDAVAVLGYRERSYNIGYCESCSEMVTEVRVHFVRRSGAAGQWDYSGDLGELIRKLTDDPAERDAWESTAVRESEDERWERGSVHSFDEEPTP